MSRQIDEIIRRRLWVRQNIEWLMSEVSFHRDAKDFFKNPKKVLWSWKEQEGKVNIYETAE